MGLRTGRSYLGWRSISTENQITNGSGYIARVKDIAPYNTGGGAITFIMSGVSTNGDYTASVKYFDAADDFRNFALLGNPYPGAISFEKFYTDNSDKIMGTAYLWTSRTYYTGAGEYNGNAISTDYATFNLTGGVGPGGTGTQATLGSDTPNGYIASEQGFMVRAKGTGSVATVKDVTFKNAHRVKSVVGGVNTNGQFFRMRSPEDAKDRYWLRISNAQNQYNEALVGYLPNATDGLDDGYDSRNITSWVVKLNTLVENEKLIIQGKGEFNYEDIVTLSYEKSTANSETLTIELGVAEGIFDLQQNIYLFDKILNKYHKLTDSPYTFITDKKTEADRFEIRYKPLMVDGNDNIVDAQGLVLSVVVNNNALHIETSQSITQVALHDIVGKTVISKKLTQNINTFSEDLNCSSGVYILTLTLGDGKTYTKKIIK